jgi:hypothetical protein
MLSSLAAVYVVCVVRLLLICLILLDAKIFRGDFWMGVYGSPTPERHTLWANANFIEPIICEAGKMPPGLKARLDGGGHTLVDRYIDKHGKKRVKGNKNLKGSQSGSYIRSSHQHLMHYFV